MCSGILGLMFCLVPGGSVPIAADEILAGVEERIRRHRMAEVTLRLVDAGGRPLPCGTAIHVAQTRHAFLFGCNIFLLGKLATPEENEAYERQFAELFNYATLPFYWWSYEHERDRPAYGSTERIVAWCKARGIIPKGHPLAWNFEDPKWLPEDLAAVMDLQLRRIGECVRRFAADIRIWDVVNEATHYDREMCRRQSPRLTAVIDRVGVGPWVRSAFRMARSANPDAVLIINDYDLTDAFANRVIRELVDEQGRPLYDVIGLQSHQHGGPMSVEDVWAACERFAVFGKPLHWTENTFLSGELGWGLTETRPAFDWVSTPEGEQRQAEWTERFYKVLFSHPAVQAITWWDFSDARAWQSAPAGLLRRDLTPKPAYHVLHRLIKKAWWTVHEGLLGEDGRTSFTGFLGDYKITATVGETRWEGVFVLKAGEPVVTVQLAPATRPADR